MLDAAFDRSLWRTRVDLAPDTRSTIISMYSAGAKLDAIAETVSRPLGTVKCFLSGARRQGLVGCRNRRLARG